jgi:hypothetical protein
MADIIALLIERLLKSCTLGRRRRRKEAFLFALIRNL